MPWCNLYSTASKYNLCIKQSLYHYLLLFSGCICFSLLLISYVTYAYQFLLVTVVLTITLLSIFVAKKRNGQLTTLQVILDEYGVCSFEYMLENTVQSTVDRKEQFQLLASSRYSFFGCWLHMAPLSNLYPPKFLLNAINERGKNKRLFIYRDSLSAEDFSRLSQVIRKLKNTS
ncbi:protein YgfX [Candidatus Colwellia aromaticivorans]|uniref:protein YgfX n=1 Tax=Candidatus Colwellia aromaticivorans TaxID=2267621 RepID=UPI003CCC5511